MDLTNEIVFDRKTERLELNTNNGFQLWQEQKCVLNVDSILMSF